MDQPDFEVWSPVGWTVAQGFRDVGLSAHGGRDASASCLVGARRRRARVRRRDPVHEGGAHAVTAPASVACATDDGRQGACRPCPRTRRRSRSATATITDSLAAAPRDLDACTKCGKCHEVCPATRVRLAAVAARPGARPARAGAEGARASARRCGVEPLFRRGAGRSPATAIRPETLWSCMQCMACVEICPVGIEHVPIINQMRRHLVERGRDRRRSCRRRSRRSTRPATPSARPKRKRGALDARARLRGQGRPQGARRRCSGSSATTPRFDPRNQRNSRRSPASCKRGGCRLRHPLRRREDRRQRRAARRARRGCSTALAEENIADARPAASSSASSPATRTRSTRCATSTRQLGAPWSRTGRAPLAAAARAARRRARSTPRKPLGTASPTTTPARSGATTASTTRRASAARASAASSSRCRATATTPSAAAPAAGRIWMQRAAGDAPAAREAHRRGGRARRGVERSWWPARRT